MLNRGNLEIAIKKAYSQSTISTLKPAPTEIIDGRECESFATTVFLNGADIESIFCIFRKNSCEDILFHFFCEKGKEGEIKKMCNWTFDRTFSIVGGEEGQLVRRWGAHTRGENEYSSRSSWFNYTSKVLAARR